MAWMRTKIVIPKEYGPAEREAIAVDIIDTIVDRTQNKNKGVRKRGKGYELYDFPEYGKKYIKSKDFKIAGKSEEVDLTLSGDMMADIQLLSHKSGELLIGFENGSESNSKAEGNIRGTYGQPKPIKKKKRNFLGITKDEKREVLDKYPVDDIQKRKERTSRI